jgi:hypothetical protein
MKRLKEFFKKPVVIGLSVGMFVVNSMVNVYLVDKVNTLESKTFVVDDNDRVVNDSIVTNFDYTLNAFKHYNHETDSATVNKFLDVAHQFSLDKTDELFDLSLGQILLESGAKQYYPEGHPNEGELVKSPVGAIGFCQIMPRTALECFEKFIDKKMEKTFIELGATKFSFAHNSLFSNSQKIDLTKKWLSNKTNNIILWGFIMRKNLDKNGSILKTLVAYNAGPTGMKRYMSRGGSLTKHDYIEGIKRCLQRIY